MSYTLVVLICWAVFAAVILVLDYACEISFNSDWVYILLTAPITVPLLAVCMPAMIIYKYVRRINFARIVAFIEINLFPHSKKRRY